ncbi:MAG: extracellular solute-binding protein [Clostridiales bacterium]|nr:extracellular solute-binding protein [Clostridiales bacterium]
MYFRAIDAPAGNPGKQQYYGRVHLSGTSGTMITKNCKNPEAAMRFINYFTSAEGEILNFYGIEGRTMEFVNGEPKLYPEAYEKKLADWDGFAASDGVRIFDFMNNQKYNWERTQESEKRQQDRIIAQKFAFDGTIQTITIIDPLTDSGVLLADIQANIVSQLTKIVMEPDESNIQGMVDSLLAEYERKGIAALEAEWTRQYLEKLAVS